ncbi:MAG TPA: hypothetical protein DCQ31_11120, partial [Bacteroidales bacterium]|nr:hypothetical protein [Bacteroidales bacterium]
MYFATAQNVTITDDDGYAPNSAAMLDVKSVNKGFLLPRIALTATNLPISATKPEGLMVWNTSTSGTYAVPGVYYWNGADWIKLFAGSLSLANGNIWVGNASG